MTEKKNIEKLNNDKVVSDKSSTSSNMEEPFEVQNAVNISKYNLIENPSINLNALNSIKTAQKSLLENNSVFFKVGSFAKKLYENEAINNLGKLSQSLVDLNFENRLNLSNTIIGSMSKSLQMYSEISKSLSIHIKNITMNFNSSILNFSNSVALNWIENIDIQSIKTALNKLSLILESTSKFDEFRKIYLSTLYDCYWFPYVGWETDFSLLNDISDIISSSRGKSKRREKRIDKAILAYYSSNKIKEIKSSWRKSDLEPHIIRMLSQALDAHLRGEYALTITCLATLWEGLLYKRLNITKYESQKDTAEKLKNATTNYNYDEIIAEFYEKLIICNCKSPDDVIEGVPNRNGISHSKYKKYPNKKSSLNAIMITDFIIKLGQ